MNLITPNQPTMTLKEITDLIGVRHDKACLKVLSMAEEPEFGAVSVMEMVYNCQGQTTQTYVLNQRQSIAVASRLNVALLMRVIDRWQELENQLPKNALPTPKELALMVIRAEEEKEAALLEVDRLQGVCNTITAQFVKGVTAPKFCKQLLGVNTQQVNNTLCKMGMLLKHKDGFTPTSYSRDRYFAEKQEEYEGKLRSHSILTMAGAKWLYRAYLSKKLPMKNNWNGSLVHMVFEDSGKLSLIHI